MYQQDGREYVRRSIRLSARDYSEAGCYFVTIRAESSQIPFCSISDDAVQLTDCGRTILDQWELLPDRFPTIALDAFVVMPDHVHGIVVLRDPLRVAEQAYRLRPQAAEPTALYGRRQAAPLHGEAQAMPDPPTLGSVVRAFKSLSTRAYTAGVREKGWPGFNGSIWQRNYYERIIRSDDELIATRHYILANPDKLRHQHK